MRTLGVDLASQPTNTAACVIEWDGDGATVQTPILNLDDHCILELAGRCDIVGIDAPFGWSQPFVELVSRNRADGKRLPSYDNVRRDDLRFRLTDVRVRAALGRWPLSVSSDRIALAAMRCAGLRGELAMVDESGAPRVFEVYPAVALKVWGLASRGYKSRRTAPLAREGNLDLLVKTLINDCPNLIFSCEVTRVLSTNDHAFDALIASLVARLAVYGWTSVPQTTDEIARARVEGWIAVPERDSLSKLFDVGHA